MQRDKQISLKLPQYIRKGPQIFKAQQVKVTSGCTIFHQI